MNTGHTLVYGSFIVGMQLNNTYHLPKTTEITLSPRGSRGTGIKHSGASSVKNSPPGLSLLIVVTKNYPQREVPHEVQMRQPS